jgi:DNA processing protein
MACPDCQRRAALVAALAPSIARMSFTRDGLIQLLSLSDEQLLHVIQVEYPGDLPRRIAMAKSASDDVPTALCRHDPGYPSVLAELPSAPSVLYATCASRRLCDLVSGPTVAIVGSRNHTDYGHRITFALAQDLASAGITVISGMNFGLEGIAHHGALHAKGQTIAVMAAGPEQPHHRYMDHLYGCICARGAVVSEFPPGFFRAESWCFIAGHRIIAALADVVLVAEAGERSIALLTARIAGELGREVAVVPGRVTEHNSPGTFELLRDGAHPISCAQDVLDLIPMTHMTGSRAERVAA